MVLERKSLKSGVDKEIIRLKTKNTAKMLELGGNETI